MEPAPVPLDPTVEPVTPAPPPPDPVTPAPVTPVPVTPTVMPTRGTQGGIGGTHVPTAFETALGLGLTGAAALAGGYVLHRRRFRT